MFRPPDIEKMKYKKDIKGLIKALNYQKDPIIRKDAVIALNSIPATNEPLVNNALVGVLLNDPERNVRETTYFAIKGKPSWLTPQGINQCLKALNRSKTLDKILLELLLQTNLDKAFGYNIGKHVHKRLCDYFIQLHEPHDIDELIIMLDYPNGKIIKVAAIALKKLYPYITNQQCIALLDYVYAEENQGKETKKIISDILASKQKSLAEIVADNNVSSRTKKRANELLLEYTVTHLINSGQYAQAIEKGAFAVRPFSRAIRELSSRPEPGYQKIDELANWMKQIDDKGAIGFLIEVFDSAVERELEAIIFLFDKFADTRAIEPLYSLLYGPGRSGGNVEFLIFADSVYQRLKKIEKNM